jgi:hypothetical protein
LTVAKFNAYGFSDQACKLVASYLGDRSQRVKLGSVRSEWSPLSKGVPQGSILGPLIFNVFINDMFYDAYGSQIYNYADDTTLLYSGSNLDIVKANLSQDASRLVNWFQLNGMKANPDKFQAILFSPSPLLSKDFNVKIENTSDTIKGSVSVKLLGVTIDSRLCFDDHVDNICLKSGRQVNALRRISKFLTLHDRKLVYNSFICSNFSYCSSVWVFCGLGNERKIENIQKRAMRFIYNDYEHTYNEMLVMYKMNSIKLTRLKSLVCDVFKCINKVSPPYLHGIFEVKNNGYNLRDVHRLVQPKFNGITHGYLSFAYYGSCLYNQLPNDIKACESIQSFKEALKFWNGPTCACEKCIIHFPPN